MALFAAGIMNPEERQRLIERSDYLVREVLRDFRERQEDGVAASDVAAVGTQIAAILAQFLWMHAEEKPMPKAEEPKD